MYLTMVSVLKKILLTVLANYVKSKGLFKIALLVVQNICMCPYPIPTEGIVCHTVFFKWGK